MGLNVATNVPTLFCDPVELTKRNPLSQPAQRTDIRIPFGISVGGQPYTPPSPAVEKVLENSASMDTRVNIKLTGLNRNEQNAQNAIAFTKNIDEAMGYVAELLYKIRTLAAQAAADYNERTAHIAAMQKQVAALSKEVTRVGCETLYNGKKVLSGFSQDQSQAVDSQSVSFDPETLMPQPEERGHANDVALLTVKVPSFTLSRLAESLHMDLPKLRGTSLNPQIEIHDFHRHQQPQSKAPSIHIDPEDYVIRKPEMPQLSKPEIPQLAKPEMPDLPRPKPLYLQRREAEENSQPGLLERLSQLLTHNQQESKDSLLLKKPEDHYSISKNGLKKDEDGLAFSISTSRNARRSLRSVDMMIHSVKSNRSSLGFARSNFESTLRMQAPRRVFSTPPKPQKFIADPSTFMLSQANTRSQTALTLLS